MEPLLSVEDKNKLKEIASASIQVGMETGHPLLVKVNALSAALQKKGAAFVTLKEFGQLRGCIGELHARHPLAQSVADNAFAAAFRDPRFKPLDGSEMEDLEIHISVLSEPEPIAFASEEDLLSQLRPHKDGLILEDGQMRGTFLPAVWESLPNPKDFLMHLKEKAGLPPKHWSKTIKIFRYTADEC